MARHPHALVPDGTATYATPLRVILGGLLATDLLLAPWAGDRVWEGTESRVSEGTGTRRVPGALGYVP